MTGTKRVVGSIAVLLSAPTEGVAAVSIAIPEHKFVVLSLQVIAMVVVASAAVVLVRKMHLPDIVGEILAGVLLGPSFFGVLLPALRTTLFPEYDLQQQSMLLTLIYVVGVFGLLFETGLDIRPRDVQQHRRAALSIGAIGVFVPLVLAYFSTLAFCHLADYDPPIDSVELFAAFIAIVMSISAMVIIVRLLDHLGMRQTALGKTIICGYAVNDILAWVFFSIIFQAATAETVEFDSLALSVVWSVVITGLCLSYAPKATDSLLTWLRKRFYTDRVRYLAVLLLGAACIVVTHAVGLTVYYGVFLAGLILSDSKDFTTEMRKVTTHLAYTVVVRGYFVALGMSLNVFADWNWYIVGFMTVGSIVFKFIGAVCGAWPGGLPRRQWVAIGVSFTPSGVTGIILAGVALERGIIDGQWIVGIVVSALISSVVAGPLLKRAVASLIEETPIKLATFLRRHEGSVVAQLFGVKKMEDLMPLMAKRVAMHADLTADQVEQLLSEKEPVFDRGFIYFHATSTLVRQPSVIFARLDEPVEWAAEIDTWRVELIGVFLCPEFAEKQDVSRFIAIGAKVFGVVRGTDRQEIALNQQRAERTFVEALERYG